MIADDSEPEGMQAGSSAPRWGPDAREDADVVRARADRLQERHQGNIP
jgi:hypothetical protein